MCFILYARRSSASALTPSPCPSQRKHILLRFECVPFYFVPHQGEGRRKDIAAFALLPGEARSKRSRIRSKRSRIRSKRSRIRSKRSRTRSTRSGTCRLSKQDVPPLAGGRGGMRALSPRRRTSHFQTGTLVPCLRWTLHLRDRGFSPVLKMSPVKTKAIGACNYSPSLRRERASRR